MYTVYVIKSESTGKIYIGQTAVKVTRLKRHNKELPYNPKGFTAKNVGPWRIVYEETFETRTEALKKEKYLKSHVGRDYIRKTLAR
ncbi:GIY-YIG nuclease family protein [Candidatus Curtissbacteria bacterium]|nr:GIY-YIG nuclease family protein [Candidatus Curtissbacteria bacterium]